MMQSFQRTQLDFLHYLRTADIPQVIRKNKPKNQSIYRDLIYKNISRLIGDSFPITKNIIADDAWQSMISDFIATHPMQTPYFLEVCQEFLGYLTNTRKLLPTDHPFILELAHFEWIQLALDISNINFPEQKYNSIPSENSLWSVSPLALGLTYSYPVHIIDECYLPTEPGAQPTYILIYRNRNDDVKTLITDNLSLCIIQLLQDHENISHIKITQLLSAELDNSHKDIISSKIFPILCVLAKNDIVFFD